MMLGCAALSCCVRAEGWPAPLHGALLLMAYLAPHSAAVWMSTCCPSCLLQALVATNDSVDAFSLLQNMAPMSYDSSRLIDVACIAFAGVSDKQLAVLRQAHRQTVIAQFAVRLTLPLKGLSAVTALAAVNGRRS